MSVLNIPTEAILISTLNTPLFYTEDRKDIPKLSLLPPAILSGLYYMPRTFHGPKVFNPL